MQKKNSDEVLEIMIRLLLSYVEELFENGEDDEFLYGERLAYTECLEWIQSWKNAETNGLDFDVEKKFPLR